MHSLEQIKNNLISNSPKLFKHSDKASEAIFIEIGPLSGSELLEFGKANGSVGMGTSCRLHC